MGFKRFYPHSDNTISSESQLKNEGFDEVLEIGLDSVLGYRRVLIKPDIAPMIALLNKNRISPANVGVSLLLRATEGRFLGETFSINGYPIAQDWIEGNGTFESNTSTPSNWQDRLSGSAWRTGSFSTTSQGTIFTTPSSSGLGTSYFHQYTVGVNTFTASIKPLVYDWVFKDSSIDVSDIFKNVWTAYVSGSWIPRLPYGLLLTSESDGVMQFFSRQTHTIYAPSFDLKWLGDYSYSSSAPSASELENVKLSDNVKTRYTLKDSVKVNVKISPTFYGRTFSTSSRQMNPLYSFPTQSYWAVKDVATEEYIIPFDYNYQRISGKVDNLGTFTLDMSSFQRYRRYSMEYMLKWNQDEIRTYDGGQFIVE